MSLINDMLNDLEKRGVKTKEIAAKEASSKEIVSKENAQEKNELSKISGSYSSMNSLQKKSEKPEIEKSKITEPEIKKPESGTSSAMPKKKSIKDEPIESSMIIHPKSIQAKQRVPDFSESSAEIPLPPKKPENAAPPFQPKSFELKPPKKEAPRFHFSKSFIFFLIIVIAIFLVTFLWLKRIKVTISAESKSPVAVPVKISESTIIKAAPEKPAQIIQLNNVQITQKNNLVDIQFVFDKTVHYQVEVNSDHSSIQLTFADTQFFGQLPSAQNNPVIQSLSGKTDGKNYVLIFNTLPQTEIKKIQLSDSAPFILTIQLYHAPVETAIHKIQEEIAVPLSPEETLEQQYEQALALIAQDDMGSAARQLKQIVQDSPRFEPARQSLVVLLMKQQSYVDALQYVNDGLQLTPDSIDLIMLKARLLVLENQFKEALKILNQISPPLADNLNYYALMAYIQQHLGNYLVAANLYHQLLQHDPNNSSWWLGLGIVLEASNRPNAAVQAYQNALSSGNLNPNVQAFVQTKLNQLASADSVE